MTRPPTRRRIPLVLATLLAAGCVTGAPGGGAGGIGEVLVEVYSGFVAGAAPLETAPAHFLIDADAMRPGVTRAVSEDDRAKIRAQLLSPYLARHPGRGLESAALHLFTSGAEAGTESCADEKASSFSASRALARLGDGLSDGEVAGARVVLFSRFAAECAPRLCEVARAMVARGAWLDVVALDGGAAIPPCLESGPPAGPPAQLASWMPTRAPSYSVEDVTRPGEIASVFARAPAGATVRVPAGVRRIRVELDPPEVIGPVRVLPGQRLLIRLMDFPLSAPNARSWTVEALDASR